MSPAPSSLLLSADVPGISDIFGSGLFLPVAILGIFYFVVMRPQQKEAADLQKIVAALQSGDRVVTTAGIHGKIHEAQGDRLVLEVSPNTFLTVDRDTVKRKLTEGAT